MVEEKTSTRAEVDAAFIHTVYDSRGQKLKFRDAFTLDTALSKTLSQNSFTSCSSKSSKNGQLEFLREPRSRVLALFVRHFFCGNCQEYLRELVAHPSMSAANLEQQNMRIVIIGCGAPSLITSYRTICNIPASWQVFADPPTETYKTLGMHRTLSMGTRRPQYIRRSLTGNALRSIWQGVRRIPEGDVLEAGSWDINGGEFLFEQMDEENGWEVSWCHRMTNSRDHTEVEDLLTAVGLGPKAAPATLAKHSRTISSPMVLQNCEDTGPCEKLDPVSQLKRTNSFRRSLSLRRQSWMGKNGGLGRVMSLRAPRQAMAA